MHSVDFLVQLNQCSLAKEISPSEGVYFGGWVLCWFFPKRGIQGRESAVLQLVVCGVRKNIFMKGNGEM